MNAPPNDTTVSSAAAAAKAPGAPRRARILGLDGPRGLACVAVLALHVNAHYSPVVMDTYKLQLLGQSLVFFFALSGFLLYLPYAKAMFADPSTATMPSTKVYALHRILRVFPGYIVIFLIACFVLRAVYVENPAIQPPGTEDGTGMITDPVQLISNLTLTQSYFPTYFQTGINPSWSLSLELIFYASLPVLGVLGLWLARRTRLRAVAIGLIAPVVLLAIGTVGKLVAPLIQAQVGEYDPLLAEWGPNWIAVFNRSFFSLADNFTFGMVAAVIFVAITSGAMSGHFVRRLRWYCGALLLPTLVVGVALIAIHSHFQSTAVALASGLIIMFIVAPLARGEDSAFARRLDWRPFRYLGEVSLSIYLWHFPVLLVLGRLGLMFGDNVAGMLANVAMVLAVCVAFAAVTYHFVERPAMTYAKKLKK